MRKVVGYYDFNPHLSHPSSGPIVPEKEKLALDTKPELYQCQDCGSEYESLPYVSDTQQSDYSGVRCKFCDSKDVLIIN